MRYITLFLLSLLPLILANCSHVYGNNGLIHPRDEEYLKAQNTPPLRIPPGLSTSTISAHYPVPDRNYPESAKKIDLTPPGLNTSANTVQPVSSRHETVNHVAQEETVAANPPVEKSHPHTIFDVLFGNSKQTASNTSPQKNSSTPTEAPPKTMIDAAKNVAQGKGKASLMDDPLGWLNGR